MHSWMYQVHSSNMFFNVACNYFMLKADVIMLLTMHVSIEPIVQSRQLQWPILLKVYQSDGTIMVQSLVRDGT